MKSTAFGLLIILIDRIDSKTMWCIGLLWKETIKGSEMGHNYKVDAHGIRRRVANV